nr:retrotransposon protein, putative, Ty1-copia subclass [Tanacetum cinerariifolium]
MYVIEQPLPATSAANSEANMLAEWNALYDAYDEVACLMLDSMNPKLHRQYENYSSYEMLQELKSMFEKQAGPKNPKPAAKEHPAKDETCHHCKEVGHWKRNCHVYVAELLKKKKQVGSASSSVSKNNVFYFNVIPINGIYEIDMHDLVPNVNFIYNVSTKRAKHNLDSTYLWHCCLAHTRYPKETMGYYFYFPPGNKIIVARYVEFFEKNLITQEVSGRAIDLEEIQDEDTSPSEITSEIPMEVEGFEPPQEEVISIRRSERTHRAPNRLCLNVEVEEHSLWDLNELASYKVAMLNSESNTWIDAMNAEIQSVIDNMVGSWSIFLWLDRSKRLIRLGQNNYIDKILNRYKMDNSKRGHILMQERIKLNKTQGASTPYKVKRMQNVPYTLAVRSIMYVVRCTRPDVAFGQNIRSLFQQNPGECHWTAVKIILKYLRNTKDMFLVYDGNPKAELRVDCYCDARFETDRDDTKSQI